MSLQFIVVMLSILVYIAVGLHAGRKVKNTADYYVSGRQAPTLLIAGTLFASMLSTNGFMGDTAWTYSGAIVNAVTLNAFCGAGYVIGVLFFGRYLRRTEKLTMPEYFGNRFNSKAVQKAAGVITVLSITSYLLAVTTGTGILLSELINVNVNVGFFIAWVCFTSFTFYSGSSGVIITDTIMFLLFLGATVIAGPYMFSEAGGLSNLMTTLLNNPETPAGMFAYHGNFGQAGAAEGDKFGAVMYGLIYGLIWLITVGISPWQAGRNMMAKNEHVALRSSTVACVCTTFFLTYLYLMSISVIPVMPAMEDSNRVIIWAAYNMMPKLLGCLVLAGIMAAGLSSASTFLSVVGFTVTNDIFGLKFKDDRDKLVKTRIIMLAVSIVALLLAYGKFGSIRIISWFASTIIASSWCVVAFGSIWSKRLTARGALWSMAAGFLGFIVTKCLAGFGVVSIFKNFLDPFFIGLYLSAIFAVLGSMGNSPSKEEASVLEKIHTIPPSILSMAEYKRTFTYANMLIALGLVVIVLLIAFWAVPYNNFLAAAASVAP
ncbi:MAG: sodium:solute symporter family protein [Deltaproteobacteria bacterium]|jgi:sodium/pantothenate symporter|nr:sodium:solute symporter family protein [Deltaproteobacteria bacterium]